MALEEKDNIILVQPPLILTLLPVAGAILGVYYARSKKHSWVKSLMVGGATSLVFSIPTWINAYNVNKQFIKQTEVKPTTETTK